MRSMDLRREKNLRVPSGFYFLVVLDAVCLLDHNNGSAYIPIFKICSRVIVLLLLYFHAIRPGGKKEEDQQKT